MRVPAPFLLNDPDPLTAPFTPRAFPLSFTVKVAPDERTTALARVAEAVAWRTELEAAVRDPVPRAEAFPTSKVPALRTVPPEKELEVEIVAVPTPFFTKDPAPESAPLRVFWLAPSRVKA